MKEKFLSDLRKLRDTLTGDELASALHQMRRRLDDPNVISCDAVHNLLISFREIQDYDAMVRLIDELREVPSFKFSASTPVLTFLYIFALNRRNRPGDRQKALAWITRALQKTDNHVPDMLCLCGRVYKDLFVESKYEDKNLLENAIIWYRKGFEVQPNEYAGINLATLLVIEGKSFANCEELKRIGLVLSNLIGRKGSLASLRDYWDVATFFEISVLAENYTKAIQAAECMFKLKPPNWYLKSTIGNIRLINQFRKKSEDVSSPEEGLFHFWMEYFIDANEAEADSRESIKYPILVLEPNKSYMPSYVTVNMDAPGQSLTINNLCLECLRKAECRKPHNWYVEASNVRGVSLYKRDERCLFLYVHLNSDDFQMFFSSEEMRARFYDQVLSLATDESITNFDSQEDSDKPIQYEYNHDETNRKIVLGKGSYGIVYSGTFDCQFDSIRFDDRSLIQLLISRSIGDQLATRRHR
jgi:mitogen-activated protein kinase kinase kinase 5